MSDLKFIACNFEVSPDGKKIIFAPDSVTVNNSKLDDYFFKIVTESTDFDWEITNYYPSLSVSRVQNGNWRITVDLKY